MTRLTGPVGGHTVVPSPDGRTLANVYSEANRPPELFLQAPRANATMQQVTTSPTAEWLAGPWIVPAIVTIPAQDGVPVPARIYRPEELGAEPNGAAVIFVHGAGYLHNVHNYWSSYYRDYMFQHMLAARGYVVLDIDYRGSAGYGRDWRTAIYRHMGGLDLTDQVDGSRYLQREFGIDPERVGLYGGSYGGFITLMALFTQAQHFGAGAALRSVTDWAAYNHGYTARILNEPQGDSTAYRRRAGWCRPHGGFAG
jgi:dipeptidyl aminopeptidase/acylaminoacyl peptidase